MIGLRERNAYVRTGCARERLGRRLRRVGAAAGHAARHAARIATNAAHDAAFERKHRAAAERHQHAAALDELLDLGESFPADAAGDVVGRRRRAVTRRLLRLLERHRAPRFRKALDLLGQLEVDVTVEQHVVLRAQVAGANVFVAHI